MAIRPQADWQAEEDARTLMRAEEIKMEGTRFRRALPKVRRLVAEKQKEARAAAKAANKMKAGSRRTVKTGGKRKRGR